MAVNIATLAIKFVADTFGVKKGTDEVGKSVQGLGSKISTGGLSFMRFASGAIAGAAALTIVTKSIGAFMQSADRIDKMNKVADRMGLSFKSMQAIDLSAGLAGLEPDALADAFDKMSKNIGSGGMSLDKRFLEQAEAIAAIKDPAEQARKAMDVFGKSGAKLLPLLKSGGKAFREAADLIKRFDLGIDDLDARNVERMNDSWTKVGAIISGTTDKVVSRMAPSMGAFLDHTIDQLEKVGMLTRNWGMSWDKVEIETTKFFGSVADSMLFLEGIMRSMEATKHQLFAVGNWGKQTPFEIMGWAKQGQAGKDMDKQQGLAGMAAIKAAQKFGTANNNMGSNQIAREAMRRGMDGAGRGKLGEFGGLESKFGTGADRDSQEAAKIISAGVGPANLEARLAAAAEKAAKDGAESRRRLESIDRALAHPIILGIGSI